MLRYFMLRVPQLMLILSVSLPLAAVFSVQVSAAGPVDGGSFCLHATALTAFLWAALALYTRETDRVRHLSSSPLALVRCGSSVTGMRQHEKALTAFLWAALALYTRETDRVRHLSSSPLALVRCGSSVTGMRQHEKAELIWQILQDDTLYRKQMQLWWRGLWACLGIVMLRGPVVMLAGAALFCWFVPEDTASVVRDWHTLSAENQVQIVGSLLVIGYFSTALVWVANHVAQIREGEGLCFRAAWLGSVRRFARQQQASETVARDTESDACLEGSK